ncbi:hypothetical protein M0R19_08755 [Candidatus Pacearchaeota archaeon]|nr:hypothetical protein [Candidatus Pacearchaeota archaeon]
MKWNRIGKNKKERGDHMPARVGVPLTDEVLVNLSKKERIFWNDFLGEVQKIVRALPEKRTGEEKLPPHLLKKYQTALRKYDGEKYCQMRQIKAIFNI